MLSAVRMRSALRPAVFSSTAQLRTSYELGCRFVHATDDSSRSVVPISVTKVAPIPKAWLSTSAAANVPTTKAKSGFAKLLSAEAAVAPADYTNRWAMVVPAFVTHLCIGSPWAWSVMSGTISKELGFVTQAAADWSMAECTFPLSIVFAMQGIAAAVGGTWAMKVGPRTAMAAASLCFGGGCVLGGLGIELHNQALLYVGYGLLAGTGVGLAYTPPVQTLISWFPDKKGLASGMTIAGFGSGALVFTPLINNLMAKFARMPEYLGTSDQVNTVVRDGRVYAEQGGELREVVIATAQDIAKLSYDLAEGVYVVGTGSTGAAAGLMTCGAIYGAVMLASSFVIKTPHPSYKPAGFVAPTGGSAAAEAPQNNVAANMVMKTPQFWLLSTTFFCVACGGMGIMSVAKPMMGEVFQGSLPTLVTAAFASQYVQMLAAGNLGGRIGWATVSDKIGRRPTFNMFTLGSIPLYMAVPYCVAEVVSSGSNMGLVGFVGATWVAITFMGGTYAILPAYEADLFGSKYVGAIHGRVLLASSAAALAGPAILLRLRSMSEITAIKDLVTKVDADKFQNVFGTSADHADALIQAKQLTIAKLMHLVPPGTPDPTPFIYDSTMYTMAGLMGVAAVSHLMVKPMNPKYFEKTGPNVIEVTPTPKDPEPAAPKDAEPVTPEATGFKPPAKAP